MCARGRIDPGTGATYATRQGETRLLGALALAEDVDLEGECLSVPERLVISPAVGIFCPPNTVPAGARVEVGMLMGTVSGHGVHSPFSGTFMGLLAHPGERVQVGQPIAWMRATAA